MRRVRIWDLGFWFWKGTPPIFRRGCFVFVVFIRLVRQASRMVILLVMRAALESMAWAEQYFDSESSTARWTAAGSILWPVTMYSISMSVKMRG